MFFYTSSGKHTERQIITTDIRKSCTEAHTETSASSALAVGISALEAQPALTWRDLQHIVALTAHPENLNASDWKQNGVGRYVSDWFGYGLLDATAMVELASKWTNVPE